MSERVIDFSDIEIGDVLDIRLKEDDIIIANAKIADYDEADDSIYIRAIGWIYEPVVESIILKSRGRIFQPGIYINRDWIDRPQDAVIWVFDGNKWDSPDLNFGHPEQLMHDEWQEKLVHLVPEA